MNKNMLKKRLAGLIIFRDLLKNEVVSKMIKALNPISYTDLIEKIADFESSLFIHTTNWTDYLLDAVLENESVYMNFVANRETNPIINRCFEEELLVLQQLSSLSLTTCIKHLSNEKQDEVSSILPHWETSPLDFKTLYFQRILDIGKTGYGIFAKYRMFTIENGAITPVKCPDGQRLDELPGYELERNKIIANTKALLSGNPANNVLLYGDAGTGKSSCVKAILNEFADEGLRLIEVKKNQLYQIPDIIEKLNDNPLKFILFIDDLSFTTHDDNFAALKAILEGSVRRRSNNVVVYTTSNRRHLIKETLSDRQGDDLHVADTMQELMSLSERFGLSVTFSKPEKAKFAAIVTALAEQYDLVYEEENLISRAETFAIRSGGRSPRVAKQFIEQCKSGVLN